MISTSNKYLDSKVFSKNSIDDIICSKVMNAITNIEEVSESICSLLKIISYNHSYRQSQLILKKNQVKVDDTQDQQNDENIITYSPPDALVKIIHRMWLCREYYYL